MYGFEAISEHNGWAISIVGVLIVFTGLVTLSLLIRVFPKIIEIIEGTGKPKSQSKKSEKGSLRPEYSMDDKIKEKIKQYQYLISWMGEPFALPRLIDLAQKRGLDRPHATISQFIHASVIQPDGKGFYLWHAS